MTGTFEHKALWIVDDDCIILELLRELCESRLLRERLRYGMRALKRLCADYRTHDHRHAFPDDKALVLTFALPVGKKLRRSGKAAS